MSLQDRIGESAAGLVTAEKRYEFQRTELYAMIMTDDCNSASARALLEALERNLSHLHAFHRQLMEEAMREPFRADG